MKREKAILILFAFGLMLGPKSDGVKAGQQSDPLYKVDVIAHNADLFFAPTYLPTCSAQTRDQKGPGINYSAWFPRHDLCATVTTSTGYRLTDDIVIRVVTDNGVIVSVQLVGQDVIGKEGIMHETEAVPISPPVIPVASGFTLHVDVDNIPVWKLDRHLGGKRVEIVGYIGLGDLVYSPNP